MAPGLQFSTLRDGKQYFKIDGDNTTPQSSPVNRIWKYFRIIFGYITSVLFCLVISGAILSLFGYEVSVTRKATLHGDTHKNSNCTTCGIYDLTPTTKAPKPNVWAPISPADNVAIWDFLHDPMQGLNLTLPQFSKMNDNYVRWIDTLPVNKSDAIPFLDEHGPRPNSYARVIIHEGGKTEPVSREYMVGPLPVDSSVTRVEKLDYIYNGDMGGAVPLNSGQATMAESAALDKLVTSVMANLTDITSSLFPGAMYYGTSDNRSTVTTSVGTPMSFDGTGRFANVGFNFPGPALYLLPIDFYILLNVAGTDASLWSVKGFVTKERFFPNVDSLRVAFEKGELWQEFSQTGDYDWALVKYHQELGERSLENRAAPQNIEIGGKRYKVDAEEKYVEYMGWSFYVTYTRSLGPMLFDIRFKGERILYELSLQEAAAQYGGYQPRAASTLFHDTFYSLGAEIFSLLEGFDCPFGSTFWNISFHEGNQTVTHPKAICIFEQDPGYPLSRHRSQERPRPSSENTEATGFDNLGVVKNAELNFRYIATVGNYDYLFNYAFGLDGSLEVSVRASGYLQGSYYYKDQGNFGPRIQKATQGSIHDHVLTFKADFDILNSTNSLQKTELRAVPQTQPWFPELGTFEQLQLNSSILEEEQMLDWAPNNQMMYTVINPNATNTWGEKRGYRIVPGKSNTYLSTFKSPWSRHNSDFAKSHLAVTRQHDTEPFANSVQNVNLPSKPQQDFLRFFNGESVDGNDLTVWFNLGMHHFTRAEDIPVTLASEATSSILFSPQNFFDRAQDGDLKNRRWVVPDETKRTMHFDDYGVELPNCHIDLKEPAPGPGLENIYT